MLDNLSKESFNEQLNRYTTRELENLVQKFPYFHQAQVLLARKYQIEGNPRFDEQLQMAALYVQDRELFYELFNSPPVVEPVEDNAPVVALKTAEEIGIEPVTEVIEDFPTREAVTEEVALSTPIEEKQPETEVVAVPEDTIEEIPQEEPVLPAEPVEELPVEVSPAITVPEAEEAETVVEAVEEMEAGSENEPVTEEMQEQPFSLIEPHTFDEWLHAFAKRDKTTTPTPLASDEKAQQQDEELDRIIAANANIDYLHELVKEETNYSKGLDKFIAKQIQKHKAAEPVKVAKEEEIDPAFVTETLAGIYEKQRKYAKAIKVYEALTLKFPEKSDLFAARIQYLKNCIDL